jgi:hypothetical protein
MNLTFLQKIFEQLKNTWKYLFKRMSHGSKDNSQASSIVYIASQQVLGLPITIHINVCKKSERTTPCNTQIGAITQREIVCSSTTEENSTQHQHKGTNSKNKTLLLTRQHTSSSHTNSSLNKHTQLHTNISIPRKHSNKGVGQ